MILICTFFGHRAISKNIKPALKTTIIKLIEEENVNFFYVGNSGDFDRTVLNALKELSESYSFSYEIVLAYMPNKKVDSDCNDYSNTIFPEGIENIPRRFAICYRNKWMIDSSDYVVVYVTNHIKSGAARFMELAEKKGKTVINIFKQL